jgi:hypothetical protein
MNRQPAGARTLVVLLMLALIAVIGEAGHVVLDQLNAVVAHHFFHVGFPLLAFAVFAIWVGRDIRLHGWPTFSWRLQSAPGADRSRGTREPASRARARTARSDSSA